MMRLAARLVPAGVLLPLLAAMIVRVSPTPAPPQHLAEILAGALRLSEPPLPPPAAAESPRPEPAALDLPSRLRLVGTAQVSEPMAWIEERGQGVTRLYREGEQLLDAQLASIGSGVVWLEQRGTWTQLRLESPESNDAPAAPDRHPAAPTISVPARTGEEALRLTPDYTPEGTFAGLLVESIDQDEWLARLGLRAGDLITAINRQPLVSPQQTLQIMRKAIHQPHLTISLERDHERQTLRAYRDL